MVAFMLAGIVTKLGVPNLAGRRRVPFFRLIAELGTLLLERVGHGGWLIGHKLFQPEAYPTCVSSKLYEFIPFHSLLLLTNSLFPG